MTTSRCSQVGRARGAAADDLTDFLEGIEGLLVGVAGPLTERVGKRPVKSRVERLHSFEVNDIAFDFINDRVAGPGAARRAHFSGQGDLALT